MVVLARAGTGKTTTILEALKHVPRGKTTLVVAFNKSIEKELTERVQKARLQVEVKTLHGFGYSALIRAFNAKFDNNKAKRLVEDQLGTDREGAEYRAEVVKAASLAKGQLLSKPVEIEILIDEFDLDVKNTARAQEIFSRDVLDLMAACRKVTQIVDFDDMVWLPVELGLRVRQFDRVFVDETQDLNKAQIKLALNACAKGGRICAVGDDRQAIYAFRGADERAVPNIIESLSAKILPLSVTYRCAVGIVNLAKEIVADYEAAPGAPEGKVWNATEDQMIAQAKAGDFVLSRKNAPLIKFCLALLVKGTPAAVQGRDIGKGLVNLIEKSRARTIPDLTAWIDNWQEREIERITARKRDADTSRVEDTAACIHALCTGEKDVSAVVAKIEHLFSDNDISTRVTLSTTHKAKGLERDRAWVLKDTYKKGENTEESNLWYVAITRARHELVLVTAGQSAPAPAPGTEQPKAA